MPSQTPAVPKSPFPDTLVRVLDEAEGPLTRARIAAHPACRDWTERILYNALCNTVDRGLVRRSAHGVYELTEAGRRQAAEISAKS